MKVWHAAFLAALSLSLAMGGSTGDLQAISAAREAVDSSVVTLGAAHPATAMMIRNLALAFEQGGYYNQAEFYANRSLAILESHFGPADVSLVPALNVLVESYTAQNRYSEAERVGLRAVSLGAEAGAHYGTALHNLGALYARTGKRDKAEEFLTQALALRESLLPAGHPLIEDTRGALAHLKRSGNHSRERAAERRRDSSVGGPSTLAVDARRDGQ